TGLSIQHYRWEADVFVPFEDLGSDVGRLVHSSAAEGLFSDDVKNWGATGLTLMGLSKLDYRMTVRLSHSAEDDESGVRFIISEHRNWSSESTPDFSLQAEAFGERVKHVVHGLSNAARDRE
ncbi:MAG: hypothetical protein OXH63_12905, partial [Gemmatimonadetes bacterium]|nr:hypothetical protein [Gemmatimonadota bacterium]